MARDDGRPTKQERKSILYSDIEKQLESLRDPLKSIISARPEEAASLFSHVMAEKQALLARYMSDPDFGRSHEKQFRGFEHLARKLFKSNIDENLMYVNSRYRRSVEGPGLDVSQPESRMSIGTYRAGKAESVDWLNRITAGFRNEPSVWGQSMASDLQLRINQQVSSLSGIDRQIDVQDKSDFGVSVGAYKRRWDPQYQAGKAKRYWTDEGPGEKAKFSEMSEPLKKMKAEVERDLSAAYPGSAENKVLTDYLQKIEKSLQEIKRDTKDRMDAEKQALAKNSLLAAASGDPLKALSAALSKGLNKNFTESDLDIDPKTGLNKLESRKMGVNMAVEAASEAAKLAFNTYAIQPGLSRVGAIGQAGQYAEMVGGRALGLIGGSPEEIIRRGAGTLFTGSSGLAGYLGRQNAGALNSMVSGYMSSKDWAEVVGVGGGMLTSAITGVGAGMLTANPFIGAGVALTGMAGNLFGSDVFKRSDIGRFLLPSSLSDEAISKRHVEMQALQYQLQDQMVKANAIPAYGLGEYMKMGETYLANATMLGAGRALSPNALQMAGTISPQLGVTFPPFPEQSPTSNKLTLMQQETREIARLGPLGDKDNFGMQGSGESVTGESTTASDMWKSYYESASGAVTSAANANIAAQTANMGLYSQQWWTKLGMSNEDLMSGSARFMQIQGMNLGNVNPSTFANRDYKRFVDLSLAGIGDQGALAGNFSALTAAAGATSGSDLGRLEKVMADAVRSGFDGSRTGQAFMEAVPSLSGTSGVRNVGAVSDWLSLIAGMRGGKETGLAEAMASVSGMRSALGGGYSSTVMDLMFMSSAGALRPEASANRSIAGDPFRASMTSGLLRQLQSDISGGKFKSMSALREALPGYGFDETARASIGSALWGVTDIKAASAALNPMAEQMQSPVKYAMSLAAGMDPKRVPSALANLDKNAKAIAARLVQGKGLGDYQKDLDVITTSLLQTKDFYGNIQGASGMALQYLGERVSGMVPQDQRDALWNAINKGQGQVSEAANMGVAQKLSARNSAVWSLMNAKSGAAGRTLLESYKAGDVSQLQEIFSTSDKFTYFDKSGKAQEITKADFAKLDPKNPDANKLDAKMKEFMETQNGFMLTMTNLYSREPLAGEQLVRVTNAGEIGVMTAAAMSARGIFGGPISSSAKPQGQPVGGASNSTSPAPGG